jgi:hypothetical protein
MLWDGGRLQLFNIPFNPTPTKINPVVSNCYIGKSTDANPKWVNDGQVIFKKLKPNLLILADTNPAIVLCMVFDTVNWHH